MEEAEDREGDEEKEEEEEVEEEEVGWTMSWNRLEERESGASESKIMQSLPPYITLVVVTVFTTVSSWWWAEES